MTIINDILSDIFKGFLYILNLLPDSPFGGMLQFIGQFDFLPFLNWFVPFDMAFLIMDSWLVVIALYYVYKYVKQILETSGILKKFLL